MIKSILFAIAFILTIHTAALAQSAAMPDRSIRVTTGVHQVSGWEKPLVQGNPNLGHWYWNPQTSYDQGYMHTRNPQRPQGQIYVKPIHVSPNAYVPKELTAQPLANHAPMPYVPRQDANVAGQILPESKVASAISQPTRVATYANLDGRGTLLNRPSRQSPDVFSSNERVSARMLNRAKHPI